MILQGGLNDRSGPLADFATQVRRTAKLLGQRSGNAPIVMIGPASHTGRATAALTTIDTEERAVATELGIHCISPLKQQWINPTDVASIIDPATEHPSTVGHAYFGGRVAQALQSIITIRK